VREGEREDGLLFLHPVGLDARCVQFLDLPGARAATFPGHGDRRRARPGLSLGDMADEVAGWTTGPVDLLGASLGGMVALHVALNHPDRVRSLVLSCTTAYGNPEVMNGRAAETEARGAQGMVAQTLTRWFRRETLARAPAAPAVEYARRCLTGMDTGALADTWRAIAGHDVRGPLAEIDVPTTCIAGEHDVSTPPAVVAELADRIPGARLERLDAAHMAHLEQPQQFAEIVRRHLDRMGDRC
jgi:3-oxoadipate enol-lactonase